jgi:Uma2 family endonuclease
MPINKLSQLDLSKRYSYADYLTWQFSERVELLKGFISKMAPGPSYHHQSSHRDLFGMMYLFFLNKKCEIFSAPFDVRLFDAHKSTNDKDVFTVVQPDILVVCDKNKIDEKGIVGAPDLIIEIVSPGNSKREMKSKYELYEQNGVKEYWIVNTLEKQIHQFFLVENKYQLVKIYFDEDTIESKLFKGLKILLNNIFLK